MDITDPKRLKPKGVVFLRLGVLSAGIPLAMVPDLRVLVLWATCVWAFSRFYDFEFYVLWDLIRYLLTNQPR
jgi:hypothetical protein